MTGIKSVSYTQMTHRAGDHIQPAGTCDRCGTGIKHVFVVAYADGSIQNYGSECINKILANAPSLKTLFNKNAKLLRRYQDYLSILTGKPEDMPRGNEYYGSGLYFVADSEGKDIYIPTHGVFHPIFDVEKNASGQHYRVANVEQRTSDCMKAIAKDVVIVQAEIARLEKFLARMLAKAECSQVAA